MGNPGRNVQWAAEKKFYISVEKSVLKIQYQRHKDLVGGAIGLRDIAQERR